MDLRELIFIVTIIDFIYGMQNVGKNALYILRNTIRNIKINYLKKSYHCT